MVRECLFWGVLIKLFVVKTLEMFKPTLLEHPKLLIEKTKRWETNNKQATSRPHQNEWNYARKQQLESGFEKNRGQ